MCQSLVQLGLQMGLQSLHAISPPSASDLRITRAPPRSRAEVEWPQSNLGAQTCRNVAQRVYTPHTRSGMLHVQPAALTTSPIVRMPRGMPEQTLFSSLTCSGCRPDSSDWRDGAQ